MTKRQKDEKQKDNETKRKKTKRQRPKREFNIVTSGQFRTLAMFLKCSLFKRRRPKSATYKSRPYTRRHYSFSIKVKYLYLNLDDAFKPHN